MQIEPPAQRRQAVPTAGDPPGQPTPLDGTLPAAALAELPSTIPEPTRREAGPFGIYLHVPFCATRCGYCDFNTYTAAELGSRSSAGNAAGNQIGGWAEAVRRELALAARVLSASEQPPPEVATVFVGGGTPSLLGAEVLGELLAAMRAEFPFSPDAEITTESNPESTSPEFFAGIRSAGFTRVSLGMQSAASHVLQILDRQHTPGRAVAAAQEAQRAGFEHVNLDLIYGTPGESTADLQRSLDAVLESGVDHVSAYSLIVEDGTALARRVRRGELPAPDDDVLAERYELIDSTLSQAGMRWYEVSNWAADSAAECHHNLGYWRGGHWWGLGPGAHSHVGGVRWWNVKHPARYAALLADGNSPAQAQEVLTSADRQLERIMLELRTAAGVSCEALSSSGLLAAKQAAEDGLLRTPELRAGRCVLTDRGRLLADRVVTALVE